jgi:glycosyltransferase involved in cell wall biosynthesis
MPRGLLPLDVALHITGRSSGDYGSPSQSPLGGDSKWSLTFPRARTETRGRIPLLYLGRLDPKKGIDGLLKSCSIMPRSSWELAIAGCTVIRCASKTQTNDLGLNHQVELMGE